ncbi:hypothetical protein NLI96_g8150 [Meripilus lineatus]|uniref:Uncharacterized protein n=1 Tax=Meripilus lineatus TaxID=2056292 RepID=A0AAD5YGJ4_9APHY|nr:hypothetical protein NLI96_g8150 [Physisporinus lineatus]
MVREAWVARPLYLNTTMVDTNSKTRMTEEEMERMARENAALRIQRAWRGKIRETYLKPDFIWTDLASHAQMKVDRDAAERGENDPGGRWRRAGFLLGRLRDGNQVREVPGEDVPDAVRKHLETQHWLELIDGRWEQDDTTENFFRWLDSGGGKTLSLKECPREQLERERITYLSAEQRINYLVRIDNEGKLRWVRNGELVDTTAGRWKDSGKGRGIVPLEEPDRSSLQERTSFTEPADPSSSNSRSSSPVGINTDAAMHYYTGKRITSNPIKRILWRNFTLRGLLDRLLRKTIKRNTWIYVSVGWTS